MSAPWSVQFKPSPAGVAVIGAAHAGAAWALYLALPLWPAALCIAGVGVSCGAHLGRLLHRSRWAVLGLSLRPDGSAAWLDRDREWHAAERVSGAVLAPWLIVLALRPGRRRSHGLLILPDALEPGAMRRLRVWLRWRS